MITFDIFLIAQVLLKVEYGIHHWYPCEDTGYIFSRGSKVYRVYENKDRLVIDSLLLTREPRNVLMLHKGLQIERVPEGMKITPMDTLIKNPQIGKFMIRFYNGEFIIYGKKYVYTIEEKPFKIYRFPIQHPVISAFPSDSGYYLVLRDLPEMEFYDKEGKLVREVSLKKVLKYIRFYGSVKKGNGRYLKGGIVEIYQTASNKFLLSGFYYPDDTKLPFSYVFIVQIKDNNIEVKKVFKFNKPAYPILFKKEHVWMLEFEKAGFLEEGVKIWKLSY